MPTRKDPRLSRCVMYTESAMIKALNREAETYALSGIEHSGWAACWGPL